MSERDQKGALPHGRWAAQVGHFGSKDEALPQAAELAMRDFRLYSVDGGSDGMALWVGGLANRQAAENTAKAVQTVLQLPARPALPTRELTAEEMLDPIDSEDWVSRRDAIKLPGLERLALPIRQPQEMLRQGQGGGRPPGRRQHRQRAGARHRPGRWDHCPRPTRTACSPWS